MTQDSIPHLIEEELSSFSIEEGKPVISKVFQSLAPLIVNIYQSYVEKNGLSKKISVLIESYRKTLQAAEQHLIPIHLCSLALISGSRVRVTRGHSIIKHLHGHSRQVLLVYTNPVTFLIVPTFIFPDH